MLRIIVAFLVASVFASPAVGWRGGSIEPQGRLILGLGGIGPGLNSRFLNLQKSGTTIRLVISGQNYESSISPDGALSAWPYLNSDGEPNTPLPAGTTLVRYSSFYLTPPATTIRGSFTRAGIQYKARWQGSGTFAFDGGCSPTINATTSNSVTFTWISGCDTANLAIQFSSPDLSNPPRYLEVYVAAYESRMDAGEIFDPVWLEQVNGAGSTFRFMDWMPINRNYGNTTFASFPAITGRSWGLTGTQGTQGGMSLEVIARLANEQNKTPWINIPFGMGTSKIAAISAVSSSATPTVTAAGHTFVNGDKVIFYQMTSCDKSTTTSVAADGTVTWNSHGFSANQSFHFTSSSVPSGSESGTTYYVSATDLGANSFKFSATPGGAVKTGAGASVTLNASFYYREFTVANAVSGVSFEVTGNGANTTVYSACGAGIATTPYSFVGMTTEITLFANYFRDNLASHIVPIFEYSNEPWNNAGSFSQYYWTMAQKFSDQGQALPASVRNTNDSLRMNGYLQGHVMKTIRDAYGSKPWLGVLNTQTSDSSQLTRLIAGVNQYISDYGIGGNAGQLYNSGYVALTGYFYVQFSASGANVPDWDAILATSLSRYSSSIEPLPYSYFARQAALSASSCGVPLTSTNTQCITGLTALWNANKTIALANGFAGTKMYEGGSHDTLNTAQIADATFCEAWGYYVYNTPELYRQMYNASLAVGMQPAVFLEADTTSCQFGPWGAMRWVGAGTAVDSNPRWNMIKGWN